MSKRTYFISMVILGVLCIPTLKYAYEIFRILFCSKSVSVLGQLALYRWAAIGFIIFMIASIIIKKNLTWMETLSHELTHIMVALLFFRKVHSLHAEEKQGVVYTSGGHSFDLAPVALAPYTIPLFTFLLLTIRCLIATNAVWIYDILIGATLAFHFKCIKGQIGNHQTDINQFPLPFSYFYIFTLLLINTCVIVVSFFPHYNFYTSIWRFLTSYWHTIVSIF